MPEVQIRLAVVTDLPVLMAIDHSCQTDYVWQMDIQNEQGQVGAIFREIRLPHAVTVPYPRARVDSFRLVEPSCGYAGGDDGRTAGGIRQD